VAACGGEGGVGGGESGFTGGWMSKFNSIANWVLTNGFLSHLLGLGVFGGASVCELIDSHMRARGGGEVHVVF